MIFLTEANSYTIALNYSYVDCGNVLSMRIYGVTGVVMGRTHLFIWMPDGVTATYGDTRFVSVEILGIDRELSRFTSVRRIGSFALANYDTKCLDSYASGCLRSIDHDSNELNSPIVYDDGSAYVFVMSRFGGGYFDGSGNPHYYVTDWQGNNIGVVDRNGLLEERTRSGGLNEYRFPARDYVPGFPRFATIDPMCEGTHI